MTHDDRNDWAPPPSGAGDEEPSSSTTDASAPQFAPPSASVSSSDPASAQATGEFAPPTGSPLPPSAALPPPPPPGATPPAASTTPSPVPASPTAPALDPALLPPPGAAVPQGSPASHITPATPGKAGKKTHPRKRWSTRTTIIASVTAGALLLAGTGAVLAATGVLGTWFPAIAGDSGNSSAHSTADTAAAKDPVNFSEGVTLAWRADSDSLVTPRDTPDAATSWLGGSFDRLTYGVDSHFYPVATENAIMLVSRGEDSRLVLLDAADGQELWSTEIDSGQTSCTPAVTGVERFYCLSSDEEQGPSVLWEVTAAGQATSTEHAPGLSRVALDEDRIVLSGMYVTAGNGRAVALDYSGTELWSRSDLGNGGYYGIELAGDQTLLREGGSWTLLDGDGKTVAGATGPSAYEGGDGGCDALLTPGGRVVVASDPDTCATASGTVSWGQGRDIRDVHAVTIDGADAVITTTGEGTTVRTFAADGSLTELWSDSNGGYFVGASGGNNSVIVVRSTDRTFGFSAATGEILSEVKSAAPRGEGEFNPDHQNDLMLDAYGTTLIDNALVNAKSGRSLGMIDLPEHTHRAWLTDAGLLVTEYGCPECSSAGGSGSDQYLSLYTPNATAGAGTAVAAVLPAGMPECPAATERLAWAEFQNGWVLVCGYDAHTPSFVQVRTADGSDDLFSLGATKPTSAEAKGAVEWDPDTRRFTAAMASGDRVVLDYDLGTLSSVDRSGKSTVLQERFVRYVFVPLGDRVRTLADTSSTSGAFDVDTPDDTAEDQVRYMIEVLERANEGRALVKSALPKLQNCTASAGGYADSIQAMEGVRDNRARLLQALDAMPVDLIPDGNVLLDDLREAIAHSHAANIEYVAWAKAANASGCAQLSAAGKASAEASDGPKERFADRWNSKIVPKFGVRTIDPWFI